MRIWTIQPAGLYEKLKAQHVLLADGRHCLRDFGPAYRWMIGQMRHRLPPSKARFPWWGWYQHWSASKPKPDLRGSTYLPAGQGGVRIELELDDREVLLSDAAAWEMILHNTFLSNDEAEDEQFKQEKREAGYKYGDPWPDSLRSKIVTSWKWIFDLTGGDPDWRIPASERGIQATFWELRLKDVTDVTFFTARGQNF